MAMFSDSGRRPTRRISPPGGGSAPPAFEANGASVSLALAGQRVTALPEGALWLAAQGVLIVSDLHLEKGSAYARGGHRLPPYDTRATLLKLAGLVGALKPQMLVALGDSFHDRGAAARLDPEDRALLGDIVRATDWVWIEGNHDPDPPQDLGGRCESEIDIYGLRLRHEPTPGAAIGEICGHLHPCARVVSRAGSVRRRCFATDGARLVMPAFGAYAGGLNVRDTAFDEVFPGGCHALMLGKARVYPAGPGRLVGD